MKTFNINTNPNKDIAPPLFPDFNSNSEMAQKMIKVKQENGPDFWPVMREVFAHDLKTLPKTRFKAWASVWTIPFMATARHSDYIRLSLTAAMQPIYHEALIDRGVGMNQQDYEYFRMFSDLPTTMNRIQAMSHFIINGWTPEKLRGINKIVELGGGIGDMCDIAYKLGFEGEYKIYDFPEVNQLQEYYMGELGNDKAKFTSDINDLSDADLVIGTWSFTEMPLDLREKIMMKIGGSKNWLIAYSNQIFSLDNDAYINKTFLPLVKGDKDVKFTAIPFMPWDGGANYVSVTEKA